MALDNDMIIYSSLMPNELISEIRVSVSREDSEVIDVVALWGNTTWRIDEAVSMAGLRVALNNRCRASSVPRGAGFLLLRLTQHSVKTIICTVLLKMTFLSTEIRPQTRIFNRFQGHFLRYVLLLSSLQVDPNKLESDVNYNMITSSWHTALASLLADTAAADWGHCCRSETGYWPA